MEGKDKGLNTGLILSQGGVGGRRKEGIGEGGDVGWVYYHYSLPTIWGLKKGGKEWRTAPQALGAFGMQELIKLCELLLQAAVFKILQKALDFE